MREVVGLRKQQKVTEMRLIYPPQKILYDRLILIYLYPGPEEGSAALAPKMA
jgi:hypothetical protein